jgi:hypothetical protein
LRHMHVRLTNVSLPLFLVDDELVKVVRSRGNPTMPANYHQEFDEHILSPVRSTAMTKHPALETIIPSRVWNPSIHRYYPENFRLATKEILMCSNARYEQPVKPRPPNVPRNCESTCSSSAGEDGFHFGSRSLKLTRIFIKTYIVYKNNRCTYFYRVAKHCFFTAVISMKIDFSHLSLCSRKSSVWLLKRCNQVGMTLRLGAHIKCSGALVSFVAFFRSSVDVILTLASSWQIAIASSFSVIEMCHTGRFNVSTVSDRIAYIAVRSSSIGLGRCW